MKTARRLSSGIGEESFPRFSPKGDQIVFSADYDGTSTARDGGADLYILPVAGGVPRKLTHHPAPDRSLDWYRHPKGDEWVLFASSRQSGLSRFNRLFKIRPEGGPAEALPLPAGEFGAVSPDGKRLAFQTVTQDFRAWKNYRGGLSPKIYLYDFASRKIAKPFATEANDAHPMWHPKGQRLYFISDRELGTYNLWEYSLRTHKVRQLTTFRGDDIRFPAIGPEDLVFEQGSDLYCIPLRALDKKGFACLGRPLSPRQCRHYQVEISISSDLPGLRTTTRRAGSLARNAVPSPSGDRIALEARGDIWVVDAGTWGARNLTPGTGEAARYPSWSHDGEHIAYFSDGYQREGDQVSEYQLMIRRADGQGGVARLTNLGPGYRYRPFWSPDGQHLAFIDQRLVIRILTLPLHWEIRLKEWVASAPRRMTPATLELPPVLFLNHQELAELRLTWSPNSRWLAYPSRTENFNWAVRLYDVWDRKGPEPLTSGYHMDRELTFDPREDQLFLYVLTFRHYSQLSGNWGGLVVSNGTRLARLPVEIGAERCLKILPIDKGNYSDLQAADGKLIFLKNPRRFITLCGAESA